MTNESNARARIMQVIAKAIMSGEAPDVIDVSGLFKQATDGVCNCPDCQQDRESATWTSADIPVAPVQPTANKQWLLSFMAQQPTREMVLELCCHAANNGCLGINETTVWAAFENLVGLKTSEFFDDTYQSGYIGACMVGVSNWKVIEGNEPAYYLAQKFDRFVKLAHEMKIDSMILENILPQQR